MTDMKRKYLRLLAIELEDLRDDLETLIANCLARMERKEISRYVCFENMAVLRNEVLSIEGIAGVLESVDPDAFESLDALTRELDRRFQDALERHGFPEGPRRLIHRKLEKVYRYLESDETPSAGASPP
jgi:hypothetical protein